MSFQAIDDINELVTSEVKAFHRSKISMPETPKAQLDSVIQDSHQYRSDFGQIQDEMARNQEGGQLRQIGSPQNMTAPTLFMQGVHSAQNDRKKMIKAKYIEVEKGRAAIKNKKKKDDEDIRQLDTELHQLHDSLLQKFEERGMASS